MRYCSRCHVDLTLDDCCRGHYGWCKRCKDVVEVTRCKVPYWIVAVTVGLLWKVQLGL
jgi:hypothetical protein